MSDFKINSIATKQGQHGPVIAGVSTVNSTGCMKIPSGNKSNRVGVSTYVLNGTIPSNGLRILLDAGDISSNDTSDPENVWRNLSDHPTKGDFKFDTIGRITRSTGATGSFDLSGGDEGGLVGEERSSNLFAKNGGSGTLFLILKPDDVGTRQTIISGYDGTTNRWDFEISTAAKITGGNHNTDLYYSSASTISADTTYTLGIVLDTSEDRLKRNNAGISTNEVGNVQTYYLNGSLDSNYAFPIAKNANWQSDTFISLGRRATQRANFEYNGEFFVFIVYDRVLDADEILQLHNAFKDRYGL